MKKKVIILYLFLLFSTAFSDNSVLLSEKVVMTESSGVTFIGNGITLEEARVIAIDQAKRDALGKAGTYIESKYRVAFR